MVIRAHKPQQESPAPSALLLLLPPLLQLATGLSNTPVGNMQQPQSQAFSQCTHPLAAITARSHLDAQGPSLTASMACQGCCMHMAQLGKPLAGQQPNSNNMHLWDRWGQAQACTKAAKTLCDKQQSLEGTLCCRHSTVRDRCIKSILYYQEYISLRMYVSWLGSHRHCSTCKQLNKAHTLVVQPGPHAVCHLHSLWQACHSRACPMRPLSKQKGTTRPTSSPITHNPAPWDPHTPNTRPYRPSVCSACPAVPSCAHVPGCPGAAQNAFTCTTLA